MKTTDNRKINLPNVALDAAHRIACYVTFPTCTGLDRVYSLHVQPMETRTYSDGYSVEVYEPRRGYRVRLEDAPRYSRKRLEALAAAPETLALAERIAECVRAEHVAR
jgi:hypothetical protein